MMYVIPMAITIVAGLLLAFAVPAIGIDERGRQYRIGRLKKKADRKASREKIALLLAADDAIRASYYFSSVVVLLGTLAFTVVTSVWGVVVFYAGGETLGLSILGVAIALWVNLGLQMSAAILVASAVTEYAGERLLITNEVERLDRETDALGTDIAEKRIDVDSTQQRLQALKERTSAVSDRADRLAERERGESDDGG